MASDYTVPSLRRAIQAIDMLACSVDGLSLAEMSKRLNTPKSTLFRIMVTLQDHSVVNQDRGRKVFSLGMKLVEWGHAALERVDLKQVAHHHLELLANETRESFYLGVLDNLEVILIDRADTPEMWRIVARLGSRSPVHATATGQVLISEASPEIVDRVIERTGLKKFTEKTITNPGLLRKRLEQVRKQGFSITDAEYKPDLCAVAVPVRDHRGAVVASLMTALPSGQANKRKGHVRDLITILKNKAEIISRELGSKT
ncbi:IclR family transcriptional regulator [bacterium]|nr:MAG: IclR family transcriptional regulator [bacterium]